MALEVVCHLSALCAAVLQGGINVNLFFKLLVGVLNGNEMCP